MHVVDVGEYLNAQVTAVLRGVKDLSKEGNMIGAAVVFCMNDGSEAVVRAGRYTRPGAASRVGFLLQLEDANASGSTSRLPPPPPPHTKVRANGA